MTGKEVVISVEKLGDYDIIPCKPCADTDSGFDIYAVNLKCIYVHGGGNGEVILEDDAMKDKFTDLDEGVFELQCNERCLIGTGIKATIGPGYELQIRPRSSLALERGLTVLNTPGTVDEQYRGEICVIIINTSRKAQEIHLGERIAQMVPAIVLLPKIEVVKSLPSTERGFGGFGSTNKKKKEKPFNTI